MEINVNLFQLFNAKGPFGIIENYTEKAKGMQN
jgi:hypothetical protein